MSTESVGALFKETALGHAIFYNRHVTHILEFIQIFCYTYCNGEPIYFYEVIIFVYTTYFSAVVFFYKFMDILWIVKP